MKAVVVLSGGMDSTVLLHDAIENDEVTSAVGFNYGQNHSKELEYARDTCSRLGVKFHLIDLWSSGFTDALAGSTSLLDGANAIPEGHYAEESMKSTVVPNRNMTMISIAASIAGAEKADVVLTAVHAGDHFIYPDCRPVFVSAVALAVREGNVGMNNLDQQGVDAPYMYMSKSDIAYRGLQLGVNFETTWSCYKGGDIHCGRCGTCVERLEAIHEASIRYNPTAYHEQGSFDGTEYEDTEFWRTYEREEN